MAPRSLRGAYLIPSTLLVVADYACFSAGLSAKGGTTNGAVRTQKTHWTGQISQESHFPLEIDRQNWATQRFTQFFNNILQAILRNAELARSNSPQDSPARDYLTNLMRESQRAAEICRQMLAYAGKGNLMIQPLDVSALVAEMVPLLKRSISGKSVLDYRFAKNLPSIEGDAKQIRQLIMNLVVNAFEAIGEKEGLVSLAVDAKGCNQRFLPQNLPEGKYVVVEVRDTGCGMNPAIRERIFEPFFTTKFTGRGLGLAAAAGIAQAHGGDIKIYSQAGRGTTFTVFLPAS